MPEYEVNIDHAVIIRITPPKTPQKEQQGLTCTYNAMKWVRKYYGKNYSSSDQKGREIEKLILENRKKLTKLSEEQIIEKEFVAEIMNAKKQHSNEILSNLANEKIQMEIENADTIIIDNFIHDHNIHIGSSHSQMKNKYVNLFTDDELNLFLQKRHEKQMMDLFNNFLVSYNINIKKLNPSFACPINYLSKEIQQNILKSTHKAIKKEDFFDSLSTGYQYAMLHHCAMVKEAELYGLEIGCFYIKKGIHELFEILQTHGQIVVCGPIGKPFYPPNSGNLKKVGGKEVYAFPPNSYSKEYAMEGGHAIVITGASRKGYQNTTQDLIYYIDPTDASPPIKTYIMSYDQFINRIKNHSTFHIKDGEIKESLHTYFFNPINSIQNVDKKKMGEKKLAKNPNSWFSCKNVAVAVSAAIATAVLYTQVGR